MPFEGELIVQELDDTSWLLVAPLVYEGNSELFNLDPGFVTDFASVPRCLVWLVPRYGVYSKSAVLHDYLCGRRDISRADADGLFRRSMRELGVAFVRRWMMWAGVRGASKLAGAGAGEVLLWLLVAIPSLIFVLIPGLLIIAWLFLFWLVELLWFVLLKPVSTKPVPQPRLWMKT
ncbi:DUF1353 domain-containing protein [Amycolatopsis sp. cg5]|uniref:DUF1353 domain-containing protein n=1 Tax=Amycolatopsis sp. cg5 TaxID=3238802 RepID=UPI0035234644